VCRFRGGCVVYGVRARLGGVRERREREINEEWVAPFVFFFTRAAALNRGAMGGDTGAAVPPRLFVIIPTLNEEANVGAAVRR
jgi:hypothetical protein